jgi:hypothetical protein
MYVDLVESLSVTIAPSGRPLAAFAHGTIAFTAKLSGVPDLLLVLSAPGGKNSIERVFDLPVFHPCIRLARWRDRPGELSFIPPDGRFVLAGYETDLLPLSTGRASSSIANLNLPVQIEVKTSLGPTGADFEVKLFLTTTFPGSSTSSGNHSAAYSLSRAGLGSRASSASPSLGSSSNAPVVEELVITVPMPAIVRNLSDIRASKGEATYSPGDSAVEWRLSSKESAAGAGSTATLRCTVLGASDDGLSAAPAFGFDSMAGDFQEDTYQSGSLSPPLASRTASSSGEKPVRDERKVQQNAQLMPSAATVSFSVKGWLASGIKVESLTIDTRRSRGLGEGVKPYKGVKYLTVSRKGVEVRC